MTVNFNNNDETKEEKDTDLKALLQKSLELNEEILKLTKKNNRILKWQHFFGILKLILILIPLILGIIYLPPFLEKIISSYQEVLGFTDSANSLNLDSFKNVPKDILDGLKR
jgi:hypothetical protein